MGRTLGSSLSFQLTGWAWIVLSSLLGLASFIGIVRGSPLPPWLRLLHVHGTLVGGMIQILIGLALASNELLHPEAKRAGRPGLLLGLNLAAIGLAVGSSQRHTYATLGAGILLIAVLAPLLRHIAVGVRTWPGWNTVSAFVFGLALLGLIGSLLLGLWLAGLWFPEWHGLLRLGHIHVGLLLSLVLLVLGAIQLGVPLLLNTPLKSPGLGQATLFLVPACMAGLLTGFLLTAVQIQLAAGAGLCVVLSLYAVNLFRTWAQAGQSGSMATDHLMTAVCFLVVTTIMGLAVGYNALSTPPAMPYGTLHLVAYTHAGFVGFLLQALAGGMTAILPPLLAGSRVASNKKRPAYRAELEGLMNRWRVLQIFSLSFGTLGLALVAALTWNMPLTSPMIQGTAWVSFGLLLSHFTLVTVKLTQVVGSNPAHEKSGHDHAS